MPEQVEDNNKKSFPETLKELTNSNDTIIKDIQDTYGILAMAGNDLMKQANTINSARKLRKLMSNVLVRNLDLHGKVSRYAIDSLNMNNKLIEIVTSKDPSKVVEEVK